MANLSRDVQQAKPPLTTKLYILPTHPDPSAPPSGLPVRTGRPGMLPCTHPTERLKKKRFSAQAEVGDC